MSLRRATLRGASGAGNNDDASGSGGGYYAISRRGFTLEPGVMINMNNSDDFSIEGNGRLTTFTVDQPITTPPFIRGGVVTHFQIYPSIPFGGLLVNQ